MNIKLSQKTLVTIVILIALCAYFAYGKCSHRLFNKCGPLDATGEALENLGDAIKD